MIFTGKSKITSHMTLNEEFSGIRVINSRLIPVNWKIQIDVVAIHKNRDGESAEDASTEATVAFSKVRYFLDLIFDNPVVIDASSEDDLGLANMSENHMIYLPAFPNDDIFACVLHEKLNAIVDSRLTIGEIRVYGSDTQIQYAYSYNEREVEENLPETVEDYYPGDAFHEEPWWKRNDHFSYEIETPDEAEEAERLSGLIKQDPLIDFEESFRKSMNEGDAPKEPFKVIEVPKWKPEIVK